MSPTATPRGTVTEPIDAVVAGAKENDDAPPHGVPLVTVSVNDAVAEPPGPNAVTVTGYVPAGWASDTRTTPVTGSAVSVPLKFEFVDALIVVVFAGAAEGVTVALPLSARLVFP